MAIVMFPLDNIEYDASDMGAFCGTRTRGVFSLDDNLAVTSNGDMTVTVSSGLAWLQPDTLWGAAFKNDAALTLSVPRPAGTANYNLPVVIRYDKGTNEPSILIRIPDAPGEYPAPIRDNTAEEIFIAYITINGSTTSISPGQIEDVRLREDVCGIMRDGVTGIPTAELYAQAEDVINQIKQLLRDVQDETEYMLTTIYDPTGAIARGEGIMNTVYPIGAMYVSTQSTNPADLFGMGTWERYAEGKVLVGVDETDREFESSGLVGGSKYLPAHAHTPGTLATATAGAHVHNFRGYGPTLAQGSYGWRIGSQGTMTGTGAILTAGAHTHTITGQTAIAGTGDGGNMPPFITVYMWVRTA